MSTESNAAKNRILLEGFVKALTSGNKAGIGACFKEDAIWHIPPYYVAYGGREDAVGRESIAGLLTGGPLEFYKPETIRINTHFIVVDETHGAYQFTNTCKTATGGDYYNLYVFTFRFDDGLIAEAWENLDSAQFNAQIHGKI